MSFALPAALAKVEPNSAWATLPLFDRTGWKRVRFGDVVENYNETCDPAEARLERFVAMEHLEPGSLHVRSWGNVADGTTFTRRCRSGQVLFGKRRAYQRKVAVAEFEAVVSGDIYLLAPKDAQRLLPALLPFLCLSERFFQHAFGSTEEEGTTNNTKSTNKKNSEDSCQFVPFVVKKSGAWNERKNIIVMVDEAHRTQEGDLGRRMRQALPHAFLFGLTGTPINRADRNTFWAFGADEDAQGYMSRYSFQDSIRDKATLPLHFDAPTVKLKIDKAAIDEAYKQITGHLSEQDRDDLAKRAAKMAVLVKNPERVRAVVEHIVKHYQTKVEPNGFKAQVVCFDRECCVLYKAVMDELIGPDASAIVMSSGQKDPQAWSVHIRDKDAEEKLLDRFRDPADPLQFVIVTSKLLTGFDAPILQAMYLDKPMKDHNLLQAICRVNRTYGQTKTHGLIVDYIGIFDDVALALDFDEKAVQ